jgi:hypothetical protein
MPATWKFVDQPVASPTVLLDMNDEVTWKLLGGDAFKLPSPPLKYSIASNAMSDGGVVSSAAYDLRTLTFTLELSAATEPGRIAQLDALKRELAKPANLLMYQGQSSPNPVFFRTLRSDEYVVDTEFAGGNPWRVSCTVMAEPFAIGIRRDLSTVTVTNDPAAASVPSLWDITGIVGDSPTPAFIRIGTALGPGNPVILAQRTANNPTAVTVLAQAESGTMGTDTTVQANDTGMSGSGSNFVRTSFSTNASLVTRLTVTTPTSSDAAALRGRYRVFARTRTSATGSNFTIRYVSNVGGADSVNGPQVSFDSLDVSQFRYTDLGILEFPGPGPIPTAMGYSGLPAQVATQPLGIQAARNSGTGTLDIDHIYLMPADERLSVTSRNAQVTNSFLVIDGPSEMAYGMAPSTTPFGSTRTVDGGGGLVSMMGGTPMLVPGVTNRWYMLRGGSGVATTSPVDVSYWPRWREVATS